MKPKHWFAIGAGVLLVGAASLLSRSTVFASGETFVQISVIVLFGLGLTATLFAVLAIVFSLLDLDDPKMALGLPDGSIRALLAFSLVLIFACLATFLYSRIDQSQCQNCGKVLSGVTDAEISDLKTTFVVAAEQARDKDGNPLYQQKQGTEGKAQDDLSHPLFDVTYYPKPNAAATDFAKQIFTTLATIFVSVVSFYFGSSVTTSAVKAAQGPQGDKLQSALTSSLANSHAARMAVDRANDAVQKAESEAQATPDDQQKQTALQAARKALEDAKRDLQDKQGKVESAQKAVDEAKPA